MEDLIEGIFRLIKSEETCPVNIGDLAHRVLGARDRRYGTRALRQPEQARLRAAAPRRSKAALSGHNPRQGGARQGAARERSRGPREDPLLVRRAAGRAPGSPD